MLFNIEQGILAEETLADLWQFAKSPNVSTLQSFPLCSSSKPGDAICIHDKNHMVLGKLFVCHRMRNSELTE